MRYVYRAYDESGKRVEGEIAAADRQAALKLLHRQGMFPLDISENAKPSGKPWWDREIVFFRPVSARGLSLFTRELAMLVKADLPLDETLRIVALQPSVSAALRRVSEALLTRILEGQSLSQAMAADSDVFPEFYWRLVRGGEASGSLVGVLDDLASFLERSAEMRARILSALLYPAILLTASGLAIIAIMAVLLPAIVPLLRDSGAPLPLVVRMLESVRLAVLNNQPLLLGLGAGAAVLIMVLAATGALGRLASRFALHVPLLRTLIMRREVARFSRTLATLIRSGVPLLDATRISGGVLANTAYRSTIAAAAEDLRQGAPLIRPLSASGYFPEVALRLIAVGDKSGQLETMLIRVAEIFEAALQRQLDRISVLITPVLTLIIGLLIGGLIVSVMGALMSVNQLAIN